MLRSISPAAGFFLVVLLLLLLGGQSRFLRDPGMFWHTVVGERILQQGFFVTDPFSFTRQGESWIPHQWLGECFQAGLHRLDGFSTQLLTFSVVLAVLFTWLACRGLRIGVHASVVAVILFLGIAACAHHFHLRPHLASVVGLAVTLALLAACERQALSLIGLSWLIPLFWLWTNWHGGVLGGLATLVLGFGGWTLAWWIGWESPIRRGWDLGLLGLILVGCCAGLLLNPYGSRLPASWFTIMGSSLLPRIIQEHARLDPGQLSGMFVLCLGGVYLAVLAGLQRRPRVTWLIPLFWLVLSIERIRHAPLFAVTTLVVLAELFPFTRWAASLAQHRPDVYVPCDSPRPVPWKLLTRLAAGVLLVGLVCQGARLRCPLLGHDWAQLDRRHWPVELLPTLQTHASRQPTPILNEMIDGGFLIYFAPGYRVAIDDRCELYGEAFLEAYVNAEAGDPATYLGQLQHRHGPVQFALTRCDSGFDRYLQAAAHWQCVQRTETAAFYQRIQKNIHP